MSRRDSKGGHDASLLHEVPSFSGDTGSKADHDEEQETGHSGDVFGMWNQGVQDREGTVEPNPLLVTLSLAHWRGVMSLEKEPTLEQALKSSWR